MQKRLENKKNELLLTNDSYIMNKYYWLMPILGLLISGCTTEIRTKSFLGTLDGESLSYVYQYEGNQLEGSYLFQKEIAQIDGATIWSLNVDQQILGNDDSAFELKYCFQLKKGRMNNAGVGVEFKFENWDTSNQVFAPAAVYSGNRFRSLNIPYPPYIYDKGEKELDMPVTIAQIPRLSVQPIPSQIEMLTSNCTTPMLGIQAELLQASAEHCQKPGRAGQCHQRADRHLSTAKGAISEYGSIYWTALGRPVRNSGDHRYRRHGRRL